MPSSWCCRLLALMLAVVGGCTDRRTHEPAPSPRPTVLLISIDTLRADHLGVYGYGRDTSPFLDRLAADGAWVEHAVVATHGTTPSHASILTSVPQQVHGVGLDGHNDDVVPSSLVNLPEVFRRAGYRTIAVTGGGNIGRSFGFDRGFDVFDDRARGVFDGRARLLRHLDDGPADRPLFLFFHTYEVHTPYVPPPDLFGRFGDTDGTVPTTSRRLTALAHHAAALGPADLAHIVARYDEGILHTDRTLEGLFGALRARALLDDAILIVTSDHGEEFGEHGGLVHRGLLYDELVRVPMILWGSRIPRGVPQPITATSLDVAPTLVGCAGLTVPVSWHGRDLLCASENEAGPDAHVVQYADRRYGVRTPTWKLIVSTPAGGGRTELYHLPSDPREQRDVAEDHPAVVADLTGTLRRWRAGLTTVAAEPGDVQLDDEERARLEALGYQ